MAVLAAPVLNWQSSPEPQSAAVLVDPSDIEPGSHVAMTQTAFGAPAAAEQLITIDSGVGYAG